MPAGKRCRSSARAIAGDSSCVASSHGRAGSTELAGAVNPIEGGALAHAPVIATAMLKAARGRRRPKERSRAMPHSAAAAALRPETGRDSRPPLAHRNVSFWSPKVQLISMTWGLTQNETLRSTARPIDARALSPRRLNWRARCSCRGHVATQRRDKEPTSNEFPSSFLDSNRASRLDPRRLRSRLQQREPGRHSAAASSSSG